MTSSPYPPDDSHTAVATGSSWTIGFGIAQALAKAGMSVVINGFGDPKEVERDRAALEDLGVSVTCDNGDVPVVAQTGFVVHITQPEENSSSGRRG